MVWEVSRVPTYEYLCSEGHRWERMCKSAERHDDVVCPVCGVQGELRISGGTIVGWFPDSTRSYHVKRKKGDPNT